MANDTAEIRVTLRACHTMANLRFCDKLIANRIPSHTNAITFRQLLGFPAVTRPKPMRLRSWCRIGVLFPVKMSLEILCGDCARSRTQLTVSCDFIQHARPAVSGCHKFAMRYFT